MKEYLGHWARVGAGKLPSREVRNRLDILGLRMGWGNGLGVMREYLGGEMGEVGHLVTRGLWKMALSWGMERLAEKESREWNGGRARVGEGRRERERGNWLGD